MDAKVKRYRRPSRGAACGPHPSVGVEPSRRSSALVATWPSKQFHPPHASPLARRYALVAVIIGGAGLCGQVLHLPLLLRWTTLMPGFMSLNSALCVTAGGLALLLQGQRTAWNRVAVVVVTVILALATAVLIENMLDVDLRLDYTSAQQWIGGGGARAGRMAPNTALAFILFSLGYFLLRRPPHSYITRLLGLLIGGELALGVLALLAEFLSLDFLYVWHGISHAGLPTIAGVLALGCAQLEQMRHSYLLSLPNSGSADERAFFVAALVLVVGVAGAGLVSLAVTQVHFENAIGGATRQRLQDRANFFSASLSQFLDRATMLATSLETRELLRQAAQPSLREAARMHLDRAARTYLPHGFSAVSILDGAGHPMSTIGHFHPASTFGVALAGPFPARLLWSNEFYLSAEVPVMDGTIELGRVLTEQPLYALTRIGASWARWGQTGEVGLCALQAPRLACFPTRFFDRPFLSSGGMNHQRFAMALAIDGKSGVAKFLDYRGQHVLAAYQPVGTSGLGMVMKMDLAEIYYPMRQALKVALMILGLLVAAGILLLRWRLRPVLDEMQASGRAAIASETRFRNASETALDALLILTGIRDRYGEITDFVCTFINTNGERLIGKRREEILGHSVFKSLAWTRSGKWFERYRKALETGRPIDAELSIDFGGVNAKWVHVHAAAVGDALAITLRDIDDRKYVEEQLRHMAQTDVLTALPNRALFLDRLERAIIRAHRSRSLLAVMYLDIDHFKRINDDYGHAAGDILLKLFAQRLRSSVRADDTVARLGGDEFTIILEGLTQRADAIRTAESILCTVRREMELQVANVRITTSIGIAFLGDTWCTAGTLLECADAALYEVKRRGRNDYFARELTDVCDTEPRPLDP